jgi:nucleoside-diphosphate-sugar epimerase
MRGIGKGQADIRSEEISVGPESIPLLSRNEWDFYTARAIASSEKAERQLGFRSKYGLQEGMRITSVWITHLGLGCKRSNV